MESTKHSHKNTPNKHQLERLNLLYETYRRYIEKRGIFNCMVVLRDCSFYIIIFWLNF